MSWTPIRIESEADRAALVAILTRDGIYEVRVTKIKKGTRYERFVEFRERVEDSE